MEEKIGALWHRLITGMASTGYPEAAVNLHQLRHPLGILFRALGGDGGLQLASAQAVEHNGRRSLLQHIAGSGKRIRLAWRDQQSLHLPSVIDCFPSARLNRDLYLWLVALAAGEQPQDEPWLDKNQRLTLDRLRRYPGLRPRYAHLVEAHLAQRRMPGRSLPDEAMQENAIRQALREPGSVARLPRAARAPQPVPLWLHPCPPLASTSFNDRLGDHGNGARQTPRAGEDGDRHTAERIKPPHARDRGLVTIRMENIFTWAGFLNLDRSSEDDEDTDAAADTAKELDYLSVSRDADASKGKLRFDLDLPAAAEDDQILEGGILLPEWDYKQQCLLPQHCRIVPMLASRTMPQPLPAHLHRTARKLKAQFQQLAPSRLWQRAQADGSELDLDAYLRFTTDRASGHASGADGLYKAFRTGSRDLACLLLADLSLSTDTWISDHSRVIDVIRDSLFLFAESLSATGDRFAMHGFSSRKRDPIRFHRIKTFEEPYNGEIRGRIQSIKPGYYTRMGAAIRHAADLLQAQPSQRRLLLILTDGKPNDLDRYEGRYGIEDTRQAIREARKRGLEPFCVTIDIKANDYLPHLFGTSGFLVIHKPTQLPRALPLLYARLTG